MLSAAAVAADSIGAAHRAIGYRLAGPVNAGCADPTARAGQGLIPAGLLLFLLLFLLALGLDLGRQPGADPEGSQQADASTTGQEAGQLLGRSVELVCVQEQLSRHVDQHL